MINFPSGSNQVKEVEMRYFRLFQRPKVFWAAQLLFGFLSILLMQYASRQVANIEIFKSLGIDTPFLVFSTPIGAFFIVFLIWVHEMGHKVAFELQKIPTFGPLILAPLGGFMLPGKRSEPFQAFASYIAGPLTGLLSVPMYLAGVQTSNDLLVGGAFLWALINLVNLLPLGPLDGGGIVSSILTGLSMKAARYYKRVSVVLLIVPVVFLHGAGQVLVLGLQFVMVILMWRLDNSLTKIFQKYCDTSEPKTLVMNSQQMLVSISSYATLVLALSLVTYASYVYFF